GINWAALRYFNVAGASAPHLADTGENNLIPKVFRAISSGRRPKVYGQNYPTPDGTCIRDYVHVADVADAHAIVLEKMSVSRVASVYNVGTGLGSSVLDVIMAVQEVTGMSVNYDIVEPR
ncbi:UDP-glucose 4-epimerase GalE, partial [Mycobacterium sp. ITM-2017-0098]